MRAVLFVALAVILSVPFETGADVHYFSLKNVFPNGKCSPVIPNFELMKAGFADGEITHYTIYNDGGQVVEVITAFVNKQRDQWALVGSKTESKVIFCLYASGTGRDSVDRQAIGP